jgi:hypothetical protein
MPLTGTRDITPLLASAPLMPGFDTEPWPLHGVTILQLMYEIRQESMVDLLPPALHPTIPPTLVFNVTSVPESEIGPFTFAEVRVGCRAAARPRGFVARVYCDSDAAIAALGNRWGYPVQRAEVTLKRGYDRVTTSVRHNGKLILEGALINPEPISGGDVQYLANMNLARVVRDGAEVVRLVQVDPDYTFHKADRGKPQLTAFDADAWGLPGADPWFPISASVTTCDMTLPHIRYVVDPAKPPLQAIEVVGAL